MTLINKKDDFCDWSVPDEEEYEEEFVEYETDCNNNFRLEGGLYQCKGFNYCPYCSKKIYNSKERI